MKKSNQPELLRFLASEIKRLGWTWQELSRRSGIAHSHFSQLKSGRSGLGRDTLPRLAEALNVSEELILRHAGYLGEETDTDEAFYIEIRALLKRIPMEDRPRVAAMLRGYTDEHQSTLFDNLGGSLDAPKPRRKSVVPAA